MSGERSEESEPLLEGTGALPRGAWDAPHVSAELREALLRRTSAIVRRRPRRWRALVVCAVAAAYVAGVGTVVWWPRAADTAGMPVTTAQNPPLTGPQATEKPVAVAAPSVDPSDLLARVASAPRDEQIRLLRQAGDLYLSQWGDVAGALYCYRQVLELMPASQPIALESSDTWLFASLKLARIQETAYENARS
jgi:hypothetical protein